MVLRNGAKIHKTSANYTKYRERVEKLCALGLLFRIDAFQVLPTPLQL